MSHEPYSLLNQLISDLVWHHRASVKTKLHSLQDLHPRLILREKLVEERNSEESVESFAFGLSKEG